MVGKPGWGVVSSTCDALTCYRGDMARTTKRAQRVAVALGGAASASQLERWTADGYGPPAAVSERELLEHYQLLASLMGEGRDGDVAVLRMAGEHQRACRRLREVLVKLIPANVPEAASTIDTTGVESALADIPGGPAVIDELFPGLKAGAAATPADEGYLEATGTPIDEDQDNRLRAAKLAVLEAAAGEPMEPADIFDLVSIMRSAVQSATGQIVEGGDVDSADLTTLKRVLDLGATIAKGAREWAEQAPYDELVAGVTTAKALLAPLGMLGLLMEPPGLEERWRIAGRFAFAGLTMLQHVPVLSLLTGAVPSLGSLPYQPSPPTINVQ